jgi:hypothetical protein
LSEIKGEVEEELQKVIDENDYTNDGEEFISVEIIDYFNDN